MQSREQHDKLTVKNERVVCPVCARLTNVSVLPDTKACRSGADGADGRDKSTSSMVCATS